MSSARPLFTLLACVAVASGAWAATPEPTPTPREGWASRALRTVGLKRAEAAATPAASPGTSSPAAPSPGFFRRAIGVLPFVSDGTAGGPGAARADGLVMSVELDPATVSLAARRSFEVVVMLRNTSKQTVALSFPTSQRIEILLRGPGGQSLGRWSDDQVFTQETSYLAINPGERVEYRETVSLRGAKTPGIHTVDVSVVGRSDLSSALTLEATR